MPSGDFARPTGGRKPIKKKPAPAPARGWYHAKNGPFDESRRYDNAEPSNQHARVQVTPPPPKRRGRHAPVIRTSKVPRMSVQEHDAIMRRLNREDVLRYTDKDQKIAKIAKFLFDDTLRTVSPKYRKKSEWEDYIKDFMEEQRSHNSRQQIT